MRPEETRSWLVYPSETPASEREAAAVRVQAQYWHPARVEGARRLGLLLEQVAAEPAAEGRRGARAA